jgi:rhodanese-related sulfurtransferase
MLILAIITVILEYRKAYEMKYIAIIAIVLVSAALLAACAIKAPAAAGAASMITPAEAKKRLDTEQGIILLDVRTAEEYTAGHIAGSLLIPVEKIAAEAGTKLPDKNAVLFVYCHTGRRSAIAASELVKMGYTQVYDLGGINAWPYEVVTD